MRISDWSSDVCSSDLGDEEIDNAISNIVAQNRLTPDQLRQQLASDGLSYDDFRRSLRDELLTQRLRQRFAQTRISVSEAEVNAALASQTGEQYHLAIGSASGRKSVGPYG